MSFYSTLFYYNVAEMVKKFNSCLHQLACAKLSSFICHFAVVPKTYQ